MQHAHAFWDLASVQPPRYSVGLVVPDASPELNQSITIRISASRPDPTLIDCLAAMADTPCKVAVVVMGCGVLIHPAFPLFYHSVIECSSR